jgi:hypothetical protein
MQIDFFVNACKSTSNNNEFGLCDDPAPANNAAYIDEKNKSNWIGIVKNVHNYEIEFIAIDHCIDIRKPDGSLESRCDGVLSFENNLIFVELKCRGYGSWLKKGREQLTNTINIFKLHYDISKYNVVFGNVCNSLKPQSHVGHATNIQQFYDATGFVLKSDRIIEIQA